MREKRRQPVVPVAAGGGAGANGALGSLVASNATCWPPMSTWITCKVWTAAIPALIQTVSTVFSLSLAISMPTKGGPAAARMWSFEHRPPPQQL